MNAIELIEKKKYGGTFTEEEIRSFVKEYVDGNLPDYQMSALLMAIYFQGMSHEETDFLTQAVIDSGETIDLSAIEGKIADKHSTGGVGDTTTLTLGPILSACGLPIAKMSGRGLGHTGGTLDKLESIPGFSVELSVEEIIKKANDNGIVIAGQSANITPADKKLYALRDTTGTVDSIPLIAASIMSKKLAIASDILLLDVKVGEGAFMKDEASAKELAEELVRIGESFGRRTMAMLTSMEQPLGLAVGNALEVIEAIETLKGNGPEDLEYLSVYLAAKILEMAGEGTFEEMEKKAYSVIESGEALKKFAILVENQGGDSAVIEDYNLFPQSQYKKEIKAEKAGYLSALPAREIGILARDLGAGRKKIDDVLDMGAGVLLNKKIGDKVEKGDVLATLFGNDEKVVQEQEKVFLSFIEIQEEKVEKPQLILSEVNHNV